jgi:beta-lactam-binding protein with PASTA domain
VIATRPAIGTAVSVPSSVALVVSGGAPAPQMPDLMGRDANAARQVLSQIGVHNVMVVRDPNGPGAPGTVVGQTPVSGAPLGPGVTVQLRVVAEPSPLPAEPSPQLPPPVQEP